MILLILNRRDFEYDIYSLIKAFYVGSEIRVFDAWEDLPEEVLNQKAKNEAGKEPETGSGSEAELIFDVFFSQKKDIESVTLRICEGSILKEAFATRSDSEDGETGIAGAKTVPITETTVPITPAMTRIEVKSAVKTLLYDALCAMTGRTLPWGDLTGIRPVKLAMSRILAGESNARTAAFLRDTYHVSVPKSALAVMIANREKALLDDLDYRNGYSLYVGIPFCPSICLYCSFSSSPIALWKDRVDDYLNALEREMRGAREMFAPKQLQTIYIGGGTPGVLEPDRMDALLSMIEENFDRSSVREYTVEIGRPDTITKEKLQVLSDHGIGRISINPQTMNQKTLDVIGRRHSVEQTREAFHLAREMGFHNINMDLIVGLPGEGLSEVQTTMEAIGELGPESVTVHALALKRSSRLHERLKEYEAISFQTSDAIMDLTQRSNEARGLYPYYLYRQKNMAGNFENVGYAAPGCECLYNILIMEEVQSILALGAGASTKLVYEDGLIERIENVKDIKNYLERVDEMVERKLTGAVKYKYRSG